MKFTTEQGLRNFFLDNEHFVFYGTGGMGNNLYHYLRRNNWVEKLSFFVVTNKVQEECQGIMVKDVHQLTEADASLPIIIATRNNFHASIKKELAEAGCHDVHTLTEDMLNRMESLANQMLADERMRVESPVPIPVQASDIPTETANPNRVEELLSRVDNLFDRWEELNGFWQRKDCLSESVIYRYLYMNRYIKTDDALLDIEAGYGAGSAVLEEVTSAGSIVCLNTISTYTKLGKAFYGSETLEYLTGVPEEVRKKFNIILALNTKQNVVIDEEYLKVLHGLLEYEGYLSVAVYLDNKEMRDELPYLMEKVGYKVNEILYQHNPEPDLQSGWDEKCIQIVIAQRTE